MHNAAVGSQKPRIAVIPRWHRTYGGDAAKLATAYGMEPDQWQRDVLDAWLAETADGKYAAISCGLSVPRQNGKNALLEMRELYGAAILGETILHTAHRVDTARKAFVRLASFFEDERHPEMMELVRGIRRTNGQEAIELANGGSVEFSSRVNGGKRGFTASCVVFDEAQELDDDQMESIMSTMAAAPRGKRQMIYAGTPPSPVSRGTVFRRERESCLGSPDGRQCWHEWSVAEIGDTSDVSRWYETNPALGIRLDEDFTERERRTLTPEGFARERLGWWSDASRFGGIVNASEWQSCETADPPQGGKVWYAAKLTQDGMEAAVAVCAIEDGHAPHVEIARMFDISHGTSPLYEYLAQRCDRGERVLVDGSALAKGLADKLKQQWGRSRVALPKPYEVSSACSGFVDAVREGRVTHFADDDLAAAMTRCGKRRIGDSGGFGFADAADADAALAEAAALAHWLATSIGNVKRETGVAFL